MSTNPPESAAIAETRLLHKMHRAATALLADAAQRDTAPPETLAELRDFLVEPVLFPALAAPMPDEVWAEFSRAVIASAPPVGAHLNIGFFEEVGTPAELEAVTANLPQAVLPLVPAMREQALATVSSLRATHDVRTVTA
ncbi:hypothetical protein [Streptomyces cellulosae]|uniref:hypothetical protein n=1 Tax=Streptomyces cellulosae TaxID=1968 RepID=UPI00068F055F|nr:hypothetical protein [Streptomyces cellulosae]